jgi:hypothetical protein
MSRCITSNKCDDKWQGILVNNMVNNALKKNGEIYQYFKDKYKVNIKLTCQKGRPTNACKGTGLIRLSKIEW